MPRFDPLTQTLGDPTPTPKPKRSTHASTAKKPAPQMPAALPAADTAAVPALPAPRAAAGVTPVTPLGRAAAAVPNATYAVLLGDSKADPAIVTTAKADFVAYCDAHTFPTWREAWRTYSAGQHDDSDPTSVDYRPPEVSQPIHPAWPPAKYLTPDPRLSNIVPFVPDEEDPMAALRCLS